MLARAEARRIRRLAAAVKLQAAFRRYRARSAFLRTRWAALVIQCAVRGRSARAEALQLRWGCVPNRGESKGARQKIGVWRGVAGRKPPGLEQRSSME